ncbi:MAG: Ppx/GppA phosphatase family protein [Bacteroidota bacterium]
MSVNNKTVAIIDLGTNTFHLLLAEINEQESFSILGKFKEAVKLGENGINQQNIADSAFQRGIDALKQFRKIIDSNGILTVFAFATSAIRSAKNGNQFVEVAKREAGIDIQVINGNTEASFIHEGVKNGVRLPGAEDVLLVDIGGGSVEFVVSRDRQALLLRSLKIGAARLLDYLQPHDPIKNREIKALKAYLAQQMGDLIQELKEFDLRLMVGSSGTFETIAAIIAHEQGDRLSASNINGYQFDPSHFAKVNKAILKANRKKRLDMKGMDPVRADMIVMGVILIDYLLEQLAIQEIMVSESALKEGILFRHMKDRRQRFARLIGPTDQDLRAKSVKELAERYQYDRQHALKVSEMADSLFLQLQPWHHLGPAEQELLRYAAVLHDIGRFVHPSGHHKHGQYLIMNSSPFGFSTNELVLIANLVRYHRKSLPKRDHYHYSILPKSEQKKVMWLGGILRIADHLDRGHRDLVEEISVEARKEGQILLRILSPQDVSLEIGHANEQKEMLETALDMEIAFLGAITD